MASEAPKFEAALAELDGVLRDLEDGTTTLEEALTRYERGVTLVKQCHEQLRNAEVRIRQLTGLREDGKPNLEVFVHTSSVEPAKPKRRAPPAGDGAY